MLLPNNHSRQDQEFALFLDDSSRVDYKDLKIDVMTCDISLLPHLALIKGANISGMTENEARIYILNFSKKNIGTRGAVEDVVNVTFEDAKVTEWFQDKENLKKGVFRIDVKAQSKKAYGEDTFLLSTRLINSSKNVRSKFDSFKVSMPQVGTKTNIAVASSTNLKFMRTIPAPPRCKSLF